MLLGRASAPSRPLSHVLGPVSGLLSRSAPEGKSNKHAAETAKRNREPGSQRIRWGDTAHVSEEIICCLSVRKARCRGDWPDSD